MAVSFEDLTEIRNSSWKTTLDVLKSDGIAFEREPTTLWLYVILVVCVFAAFLMPIVGRGHGVPLEALPAVSLVAGVLIAIGVALRFLDVLSAGVWTVTDDGIELRRGGLLMSRVKWASLQPAGTLTSARFLRSASGETIWLPSNENGRELLLEICGWCREHKRDIERAGGSLSKAVEDLAARRELKFTFDSWGALQGTVILTAILLLFVGVGVSHIAAGTFAIVQLVFGGLITTVIGYLAWSSWRSWGDLRRIIVVSTCGITVTKNGSTITDLMWRDIAQPEALKQRNDKGELASDASGTVTISAGFPRHEEVLNMIVDYFIVRELQQKGLTRSLRPADVWGDLVE